MALSDVVGLTDDVGSWGYSGLTGDIAETMRMILSHISAEQLPLHTGAEQEIARIDLSSIQSVRRQFSSVG